MVISQSNGTLWDKVISNDQKSLKTSQLKI